MKRLTEIGLKLGTDKAEYHEFTEFYEEYFEKVAASVESPTVLEIGILDGKSLKMYDEFFNGKAKILGVDTAEKGFLFQTTPNISSVRADILMPESIEKIKKLAPHGFDIIIDDGGHTMELQQKALLNLWPLLKPGGYFIIEDLHTSGLEDYNPDKTTTTLAMLKGLGDGKYFSSAYINEETLKELDAEMESVIVCENEFPQMRTQPPRMSITSLIIKKETEALKEAKLKIQAQKVPIIEHNLGDVSATTTSAIPESNANTGIDNDKLIASDSNLGPSQADIDTSTGQSTSSTIGQATSEPQTVGDSGASGFANAADDKDNATTAHLDANISQSPDSIENVNKS